MNVALTALTEELRRLKAAGTKSIAVSDETMAALHKAVKARASIASNAAASAKEPAPSRSGSIALPAEKPRQVPAAPAKVVAEVPEPAESFPAPVAFTIPEGTKSARMTALREHILNDAVCRARVRPGKKIVVGVGSLDARIMFVGEAPGAEEELQGEPFVGPAGQLLTKMIGAMGLQRSDVYIGNIMNWRPEMPLDASGVQYGNRPPSEGELRYCLPYLRAQIEIVNPDLLVALGTTAAQGLLGYGSFKALSEVRGRWTDFAGKPLMITYHPSYILRNQSNRSKRMIWEDLLHVMERAGLPISEKQRTFFLDK
jgi:uracil-DNA glycosylase family 4